MIATSQKIKEQIKRKFIQMGFESPVFDEHFHLLERQKVQGDFNKIISYVLNKKKQQNQELLESITEFQKWVSEWTNEPPKCRLAIERNQGQWTMEMMLYGYLPYNVFPTNFDKEIVTEQSIKAEVILKMYVDEVKWNQFQMKWLFAEWTYEKQFQKRDFLFAVDEEKIKSLVGMEKIIIDELEELFTQEKNIKGEKL